jgi:hypothetical protein
MAALPAIHSLTITAEPPSPWLYANHHLEFTSPPQNQSTPVLLATGPFHHHNQTKTCNFTIAIHYLNQFNPSSPTNPPPQTRTQHNPIIIIILNPIRAPLPVPAIHTRSSRCRAQFRRPPQSTSTPQRPGSAPRPSSTDHGVVVADLPRCHQPNQS